MKYRIALITMLFVVMGTGACLAVGPFSGSWEMEIGLSPQQTKPFSSFSSTLGVSFCVGFLELSSSSDFVFSGWLWQEFGLSATLGFVSVEGLMLFEPQSGSFLYAQGMVEFDFCPVVIKLYGAMVGPSVPGGLNYGCVLDLYGELPGGIASIESATFFGADLSGITFTHTTSGTSSNLLTKTYTTDPTIDSPAICFSGEELIFKANAFCCLELTSITTFATTGFESQEFELSFMHLFGLPLNLTLSYFFSVQTKTHTFTPYLETDYGCLKIYTDIVGSGGVITGLEIYGIEFQATFAGATFTSLSNLDTSNCVITTAAYGWIIELESEALAGGHLYYPQEYWEVISLVAEIPLLGCGSSFFVHTFFSTSSGLLFDWAESEMGVTIAFGDFFSVTNSVAVDTSGFTEWKIAMKVTW